MKTATYSLIVALCLFFNNPIAAAFLFNDGTHARHGTVLNVPELATVDPSTLPEEEVLIFADPNSVHPEAKIVTIAKSNDGKQWMVASATIENPALITCNSLKDAQRIALAQLQPIPERRIRIPKKNQSRDRQSWRRA